MLCHALPSYVSKILHDARPADLPVEEFTHFELVINLRRRRSPSASQPPRSPAPTRESNFCKRTLLQVLTPAFGTLLPCRPPSSTRPLMKEEETYDRGL